MASDRRRRRFERALHNAVWQIWHSVLTCSIVAVVAASFLLFDAGGSFLQATAKTV